MNLSACPYPPKQHQVVGIQALLLHPAFALFDEVGAGKSLQTVAATCALFETGHIDALLVVAPASVRSVWADPDPALGEFAKHRWAHVPSRITEYCARSAKLPTVSHIRQLEVVVTNYELVRRAERLEPLLAWVKARKTAIVFDESWAVQNHTSQQYKACRKLRAACVRATCLNGTPGNPANVFNQFFLLDPAILGFKNFFAFRGRHAAMGGYLNKQIIGWHDLELMQARMAPFALRRMTHDCFDLPATSTTQIEARLSPTTWSIYSQMRDEMVAWLSSGEASVASQAGTKIMRLAQLTSGFIGGVVAPNDDLWTPPINDPVREIGREKLDALLEWLPTGWSAQDKLLVFTRFRAETERTARELQERYPNHVVRRIYGSQDPEEREEAKRLLAPGGDPRPTIVVANTQSGGAGLNFAAAHVVVFLSNDYSLKSRLQAAGRVDRPGQTSPVRYIDVIACGPKDQKTVDHGIAVALRNKTELADATVSVWTKMLEG